MDPTPGTAISSAGLVPIALGVAATVMTLCGGLLALRVNQRAVPILGLAAGIVLGVALFDLLPEAIHVGGSAWSLRGLVICMALGLALYMLVERASGLVAGLPAGARTHLGPAMLSLHSLIDGLGIGLAFQIDQGAGWLVAIAVLTHDLADGVNTVSLCCAAGLQRSTGRWLVINAMAPLFGVLIGLSVSIPAQYLAPLLAGFAGVFLYLGACVLVPRSQTLDPRLRTTAASFAGMALMLVVTGIVK